jgi:cytochrome c553
MGLRCYGRPSALRFTSTNPFLPGETVSGMIALGVLVLIALILAFASFRAWRIRSVPLRIVTGSASTLLTIGLAFVSVIGIMGVMALYRPQSRPAPDVTATASPEEIAAASRRAIVCAGCHSSTGDVPLDGGQKNLIGGADAPPLGTLWAPNLTPGGRLATYTDGELIRAIREGIDKDGHALIVMPSAALHNLSDDDARQLVAFLRSQPAIQRETPQRDLSLLALLILGAGVYPTSAQPPITQPVTRAPAGVTSAYGKYLVDVLACADCHGANLTGGKGGLGPPPGPNLTQIVPRWSEQEFLHFFETGSDPAGHTVSLPQMPWEEFRRALTDDELRAIYEYLHSLPPVAGPTP